MGKLFNAYRYFIVPSNNQQLHFEHHTGRYSIQNKEQLVKDFFEKMKVRKKSAITYRNHKYLIYLINDINDRYLLIKLAKEKLLEIHEEGEFDLENATAEDYPFIYLMIDQKKQIILIEHKSNIFNNATISKNIFEQFLCEFTQQYHYIVRINPMLIEDSFWETVKKVDMIHEIELSLESPNLFDGIINFNNFMKRLKEKYNNNHTKIKLINNDDSLIVRRDNQELKSAIDYVSYGGGNWKMKVVEDGRKTDKESYQHRQKIVIDEDIENLFNKKSNVIKVKFGEVKDVIKDENQ